ncbi:unnamed protein product [Coffea canephora]|uniref:DH200=94 genomic scaffold, scaffold_2620 n=1 Tax=Coffea canephora TaxID=49390 RepID=A0A068VKC6_COFCA|nr:unnamed protein product [Coffea canephora]
MADALVAVSIQIVLEKLVSATTDVIGVAFGGFKEELEKLKGSVAMIQAVMADAEKKQVQNQDVQLWLKRLEGVAFDADNLLDEINYEFLRRRTETQNRLKQKVKNLNMKLKSINQEAVGFGLSRSQMGGGAYVSPLPAMSRETDSIARQNVVGRATDASNIVGTLLSSSAKVVSVIPITGLGGLGKTTLAQLVYNVPEIDRQFDKKIWVCVSRNFEVTRLFKLILESLTKRKVDVESRESIVQEVRREIEGKRYFLVLDDVWNERSELWEDFIHSLVGISTTNGNWILVTTRNIEVATRVATHPPYSLSKLGDDDCWSIVKERVFPSGEVPKELEVLKSRIIKRCQGLPLAATVIGGLLRFKRKEEWLAILESGFARLGGEESSVMQLLKLSFDHLPSAPIKKCFAYCSIFGKGFVMSRQCLTLLWMAEGFLQPRFDNEVLEDIGKEHFDILLQSSLFEEAAMFGPFSHKGDRYCTMHDFVHDLAQSVLRSNTITDENCRYLFLPSFDEETQGNLKSRSSSLRTLLVNGTVDKFRMPKGMGQLTCLQTLQFFNIGKEEGCKIEEVGCLKNLRGQIVIRNLEFVNAKREAHQADLLSKPNLNDLAFEWGSGREGDYNDEDVLEGLLPHPNLQSLYVKNYMGSQFPRWLMNMSIAKLVKLVLVDCKMCEDAPALGRLPSLEFLALDGLDKLTCLGRSFYDMDDRRASRNNSSSEVSNTLFPALKSLVLSKMPNLREWMDAQAESRRESNEDVKVFPILEDLTIKKCYRLPVKKICSNATNLSAVWIKGMADLTHVQDVLNGLKLQSLILEKCPELVDIHGGGTSLRTLSILECENIRKLPKDLHQLQNLDSLVIGGCHNLETIPIPSGQKGLTSLKDLRIGYCNGLTSLPVEMLEARSSLLSLMVCKCPNLVSFPIDLRQMPSLVSLALFGCPKLTTIPKGLDQVSSLSILSLVGQPQSDSLPVQLQYLTSLTALGLHGFGVEVLPDWLANLASLEELRLDGCEKLQHLPSTAAMRRLTKLKFLGSFGCSLLEKNFTPGATSEWPKIFNISHIQFADKPIGGY